MDRVRRKLDCPMCYFRGKSNRQLITHCLTKHKNEGSFRAICCAPLCQYATSSWNAYKLHYRRKHPNINVSNYLESSLENRNEDVEYSDSDDDDPNIEPPIWPFHNEEAIEGKVLDANFRLMLAKYFLSLEAEHKVSKTALNSVSNSTAFVVTQVIDCVLNKINKAAQENSVEIPHDIIQEVSDHTKSLIIGEFDNFMTTCKREKLYASMPTMVKPRSVLLGQRTVKVKGKYIAKKCYGYCVPLKDQLQLLLNMPEVLYFFRNPSRPNTGFLRDVNDGEYVKGHPLNQDPSNFLKLCLSFDDVELQNPLRSFSRHKLAMIYFSILNIPVEFRSKLKTIFLVATAKSKDIQKFGLGEILRDFVRTTNELATNGISLDIQGNERMIHGTLLYCICDNPAAAQLGGFKMAPSFAFKGCRRCYASQNEMKQYFIENKFRLRDMDSYLDNCKVLQDRNLSPVNIQYWSKRYGVNEQSVLCKISDFPVTSNLVMDNCHVLLEGLLPNVVGLLLNVLIIQQNIFSLDFLNECLANFPYHYTDTSHLPELIQRKHILTELTVKQKAVAMLLLCFTLPQIIGFMVGEENRHYKHFIMLVKITQLCFSPYVNMDSCGELSTLIELFGNEWQILYPGIDPKPKLHYLVHMVEQIKKFGSLHSISALRFESKHGFFKDYRWHNFKNIAYSLAEKHQLYMAHKLMNMDGTLSHNFIYSGDEIGEGEPIKISERETVLHNFLVDEYGWEETYTMYETDSLRVRGNHYQLGAALLIGWDDVDFPVFAILDQILIHDERKIFVVNQLETLAYLMRIHSYQVEVTNNYVALKYTELVNKFPLQVFKKNNKCYIMNKYAHFTGGC